MDVEKWGEKGLIPGPKESEADFLKRVERQKEFYLEAKSDVDWSKANEITKKCYGFSQESNVALYEKRGLSFFEGGATFFNENGLPVIQLKKRVFFGLYSVEEILAHEAVHAARAQFNEPYFEEILAYKTSPHPWRRFFGPLFQKPWESYLFILLLTIPVITEIVQKGFFLNFLPIGFFLFLFARLSFLQFTLHRALKNLKGLERQVLFLTDREIFLFAFRKTKIEQYVREQKSYRWKLLRTKFKI